MRRSIFAVVVAATVVGPCLAADRVTIGHTNSAADVGVFVAQDNGHFAREGIDAQFEAFDSGSRMIAPFATGDLDVGGGATSAALYNAIGRKIPIKIVADKTSSPPGRTNLSVVVRKDLVESGRFKKLSDLKGMKLGTNVFGTSGLGTINKLFERAGIKSTDIEAVNLGYPAQLLALQNRGIDAATPLEPITSEILSRALAVKVIGDDELYPFHQVSTLFYAGSFAAKKDLATRFMRAYIRGLRDYNDAIVDGHLKGPKADRIIEILVQHTTIKDPALFRKMIVSFCDPNGDMDQASLVQDLELFKREGLIEHPVRLEDALDTSFLEAAKKTLGEYVWPEGNLKPTR